MTAKSSCYSISKHEPWTLHLEKRVLENTLEKILIKIVSIHLEKFAIMRFFFEVWTVQYCKYDRQTADRSHYKNTFLSIQGNKTHTPAKIDTGLFC